MVDLKFKPSTEYYEDDPRTIVVPSSRKRHWAVMIDLLSEFGRVCSANGIKWFVDGGTLLGAVRHGGFIPWDDDVDINMLRADYEKLKAIAPSEFHEPYFFQTNDTDSDWTNLYARLCNSDTAAIAKASLKNGKTVRKNNQGIFIDIFPLDKVPDDIVEREHFLTLVNRADKKRWFRANSIRLFQHPTLRILTRPFDVCQYLYGGVLFFLKWSVGVDMVNRAYRRVHLTARKYENSDNGNVAEVTFIPDLCAKIVYPADKYTAGSMMKFEYISVPTPLEPETYLKIAFGDWKTHVVGAGFHGDLLIDVDKSYREYMS